MGSLIQFYGSMCFLSTNLIGPIWPEEGAAGLGGWGDWVNWEDLGVVFCGVSLI